MERDGQAWSFLMVRLANASFDPRATLKADAIGGVPGLGFYQSGTEAMVYRLVGGKPQVLIIGHIRNASDRSGMITEAVRRAALR
jgi:hypothetical protein